MYWIERSARPAAVFATLAVLACTPTKYVMRVDKDNPRTRWALACYEEWKEAKAEQFFAHFANCPRVTVTKGATCGAKQPDQLCFTQRTPRFEAVLAYIAVPLAALGLLAGLASGPPYKCWLQCGGDE